MISAMVCSVASQARASWLKRNAELPRDLLELLELDL
jgi:hypothetical protein